MTISQGLKLNLESRNKHLETSKFYLKDYEDFFEYGAVAATLTNILAVSDAPNLMDFLSLDVEGAEMEVLKGLDFNMYNFKYILVEHYNFEILSDFLRDKGYKFLDKLSYHDYLFKFDKEEWGMYELTKLLWINDQYILLDLVILKLVKKGDLIVQ